MPPNEVTETPIPNQQVVCHGTSIESENYVGNFVVDDFVTASYERKIYPGQTADLDEESFKASKMLSRRMRWAGHVARMGEDRSVHRMLVGKPEEKRPLGISIHKWEDNIKMDLQEVGGGRGGWLELVQDRDRWRALVGTVRDFRVP
jgi:hypothetical protein